MDLDVRPIPKPQRHRAVFAAFANLGVGESFILITNHDPAPLRAEFDSDQYGASSWEYLERGPEWRLRVTRTAATPLPRVVADTLALAEAHDADASGAVFRLTMGNRDLDSNVIALPPHGTIGEHVGPDLDVLLHVISGSGTLATEGGEVPLSPGALVWLPRRSRRQFTAGALGLRYLSVHQRKSGLGLTPRP
ncbi:DUF2249 domain-containing protein [Sinomonas sp. ASV486]|uniref:DUF2249 domain-containing protein n=1 Tax=Sinomonas puerhi TaxID=3238584 RepID=A0AB39KZB5_9MICC|nr:DUF2249 domain-containing protein [Sinomonas sp. ASV486]MDQ4491538.1 DUF2249 domain-containing protein [Sinomonas sp. ASV486]